MHTQSASPLSLRLAMIRIVPFAASLINCRALIVQINSLDAQFSGTPNSRKQRSEDDRENEERSDLDAFGSFVNVLNRRVDEDQSDQEIDDTSSRPFLRAASVTAIAAEVINTSTPVA